jgi:hypothetical protein
MTFFIRGSINARPMPQEEAAAHEKHIPPVAAQTQHAQAARGNPQQRVSVNQGKPGIAATPKPGAFSARADVPAKEAGAPYNPAANRAAENKAGENKAAENKASTPGPENESRGVENAAQPESIPRTENAPHPAAAPRPEARPESAPRPEQKAPAEQPEHTPEGEEDPHP